jgi:uncharacterized protein (TIGR04255 family)
MSDITYCENSTITEAWAVIRGVAGKVDEAEAGAVTVNARKLFGEFQGQPSIVLVEGQSPEAVPPFWREQLLWNNGKNLARIGHRYLSVHYIQKGGEKYRTYDDSLQPEIEKWLEAYEEALEGTKEPYPIDRISFGYINTFVFEQNDFDLSQYFKVNIGIGAESAKNGIAGLELNFVFNKEVDCDVVVNLNVSTATPDKDLIQVRTTVEALVRFNGDKSFLDVDSLLTAIYGAKETAKHVFFDMATEKTKTIMGVQYAKDGT